MLTDPAAIVRDSMPAGRPLPVDYDHAIDRAAPNGGSAPAAGWISRLDARPDGVWGLIEWTEDGARAVQGRQYRFISPTFSYTQDGRQVTKLLRAALTNNPAIAELMALSDANSGKEIKAMDELLQQLRSLLGLPESADAKAVVSSVRALKEQADKAATDRKAMADAAGVSADAGAEAIAQAVREARTGAGAASALEQQVATLSARVQSLDGERIAGKVDAALRSRKFAPSQRDEMLALCQQDEARFDRLMAGAVPLALGDQPKPADPPAAETVAMTDQEKIVCLNMGISTDAYAKGKKAAAERAAADQARLQLQAQTGFDRTGGHAA